MNTKADEPALDSVTLELAETRPDMLHAWLLGSVPVQVAALLLLLGGVCMSVFGIKYALWAPLAWLAAAIMVKEDYHATTRFTLWLNTSAWTINARDIGGSSVDPSPLSNRRVRGIFNAV